MDPAAALQRLGFSEYEARAYVALVKRSPMNGYELAKASGIPRANIYAILDKLTERRAIFQLNTETGIRYGPVSPDALIRRLGEEYQRALDLSNRSLTAIAAEPEFQYVWNARGYAALLDQARTVMRSAGEDLLVALWPAEAAALADDLSRAEHRNVKITTLCMAACSDLCGGCLGDVHRYRVTPVATSRWFIAVGGGANLVAGEISSDDDTISFTTRQPLIVELAASYIRNAIALNTVVTDLGPRLDELLSAPTKAVLDKLGPRRSVGFLEYLRRLMRDRTA